MRRALVLLLLAACGGAAVPAPLLDPGTDGACKVDDDCVLTSFGGCCSCPERPHGMNRSAHEKRQQQCAVVDCTMPPDARCEKVEPASGYRVACRRGRCEALRLRASRNEGSYAPSTRIE